MCEKYNGWTNYETWAVNLWITNDQDTYNFWRETAEECLKEAKPTLTKEGKEIISKQEQARFNLADRLEEYHVEEIRPELDDVYDDLLGAALSSVNWSEIAKSLMEE